MGCDDEGGAVFRSINRHGVISPSRLRADSIARIIKGRIQEYFIGQGMADSEAKALAFEYSGHSLRAGFVTSAFNRNVPESTIMPHTRHKKLETLYKYRRMATVFKDNPSSMVGL